MTARETETMVTARTRQGVSWTLAILVHVVLLLSLNSVTLAGGRPGPTGVPGNGQAVTLTLGSAAPGTPGEPRVAETAPPPKAESRPQPEPKPRPRPHPKPKPATEHRPTPKPKPKPKPKPAAKPRTEPTPAPAADKKPEAPAARDPQTGGGAAGVEQAPQVARGKGNQAGAMGRAGEPGAGAHDSGSHDNALDRYLAKVRDTIEYNKVYPARARLRGQQGEVEISFRIDNDGHARKVTLARSSHSDILDRESVNLVQRLHFPAPPDALSKDAPIAVTIPIRYRL